MEPTRAATRLVDNADFVRGIETHLPALRQYIARRVPGYLVDDVLQETLLGACLSEPRRDPARPWLPWLYTIARRTCVQVQRREMRHLLGAGDFVVSASAPEPAEIVESARLARVLDFAWWALSPRHRRLLHLRFVEGHGYDELVDREDEGRDVLMAAVHRARTRLQQTYAEATQRIAVGIPALAFKCKRSIQRLLRDRLASLEGLAAGFVSAGVVTAALMTIGATGTAASSVEQSVPTDVPPTVPAVMTSTIATPTELSASSNNRPGEATSVVGDRPTTQPRRAPEDLPLRSTTVVDVGTDRTDAAVTISVDDPTGQSNGGLHVTIECNERSMVFRTACAVAGSTPNAD